MSENTLPSRIVPVLLFVDGLIAVSFAVFAHLIGLDPSPGWGVSRYAMMALGLVLLSMSLLAVNLKVERYTRSEAVKTIFLFAHLWLFVFLVYAWFITYGNITTWQKSTRYYAHLADAFSKGQLYVDIKPNVDLVEARDPYDSEDRPHFDDEIWDMSLYKGKLYIYWGPVPALFLMPFQARANKLLPDIYLVYAFFCGLFIINSLILLKLRQQFYPDIPFRYFVAAIFLIGFILPILWSINVPEVYEAAIGAGQLFLMGGIYFSLLYFTTGRKRYLLLVGLFGACSVGSRAVNVFSIAYMFGLLVYWIFKERSGTLSQWKRSIQPFIFLVIPLILGAVLIALYNWMRFDSPFEFGLRYQITVQNLNRDSRLTFQPAYFPFNFFAYVLQPFGLRSGFPFIQPIKFSALLEHLKITQPGLYAAGPVAGILFSMPFLLLAILPLLRKKTTVNTNSAAAHQVKKYFLLLLAGSLLINFMSILFYFYGQMRFLVDFISQFSLLAIMGYWGLVRDAMKSTSRWNHVYVNAANILLALTLLFSVLLSFSSEANRMEKSNPVLMEKINSLFMIQSK